MSSDDDEARLRAPRRPSLVAASEAHDHLGGSSISSGTATSDSIPPEPLSTFRTAMYNFSSIWFLIPQGLGVVAIILHELDFQFNGLSIISYIVWAFAGICLALFVVVYAVRVVLFPRHVGNTVISNNGEVACFSSISIAFTSVIIMIAVVAGQNEHWARVACNLWWVNMVLALLCTAFVPYIYIDVGPPGLASLSPVTQLPMIAAITLAAGGGMVAQHANVGVDIKAPMILVSLLFVSLGVPLAFLLSGSYLLRLFERLPPAKDKVYQEMIFCGPWGQGSFAFQSLGLALHKNAPALAAYSNGLLLSEDAIRIMAYGCMFIGFLAWGQGTFWWLFACCSVLHSHFHPAKRRSSEKIKFTLTEWSLVFPWGVYTNAAVSLGKLLDSNAFRVWSTVLAIALVLITMVILGLTARGLFKGSLLLKEVQVNQNHEKSRRPSLIGMP